MNVIQIGANDGKSQDPLHEIIKLSKTNAILVEPVPVVFEQLQLTYADCSSVRCLNLAVTDSDDEWQKPFYHLAPKEGLYYHPSYTWWGSFERSHLEKFRHIVPHLDELLECSMVPCISISQLVAESGFRDIHILETDVEGFDEQLIRSLDLDRFKPEVIYFESYHIPKPNLQDLIHYLSAKGYRCYCHGLNTICFRKDERFADLTLRLLKFLHPSWLMPVKAEH